VNQSKKKSDIHEASFGKGHGREFRNALVSPAIIPLWLKRRRTLARKYRKLQWETD